VGSEGIWEGPPLEPDDIWLPIPNDVSPTPGLMVRVPTEEITFDLGDIVQYPKLDLDYFTQRYMDRLCWSASLWRSYVDPGRIVAVDSI
jgi:hypothetical protein